MTRQAHRSVEPTERRDRIVEAASDCIARLGIHGATMAQVATRAALGVGQVYRIFESKEAIIARIAADDLAETRAMLEVLENASGSVVDALCALVPEAVDRCFDVRRIALRVEFAAEAARNPAVAEILRSVDGEGRAAFERAMESARKPGGDPLEFQARCECAYVLFDGLAIRSVNHPNADRVAIGRLLQSTLRDLFH